jgi:hypothetical protein
MFALSRAWGTSAVGAGLAALGYAFGAPVLFQYCNVIFLVGAAWLPLGFRAADRWLRLGRRWGLIELAMVLALQTTGGDPEAAYVLGICAAGYAVALRAAGGGFLPLLERWGIWLSIGLALWAVAAIGLAAVLPGLRPPTGPGRAPLALPWMRWVPLVVLAGWVGLASIMAADWWRKRRRAALVTGLAGLIVAALLGAGLSAAQLLPVLEFTALSGRAAGQGPHDIYPFSLSTFRLTEFAWPNVFGTSFHGNRSWMLAIPHAALHSEVWVPTLYLGGMTLTLALGALGFRGDRPWHGWLSAVAIVTLLGSLGEFTSPLWLARWFPACHEWIGPHDPNDTTAIRLDGHLRDGDGGFYWFLATVLPGFRQFRFPSKLLTFTALAMAGLAGIGWDRLAAGEGRRSRFVKIAATLSVVGALLLGAAFAGRDRFLDAVRPRTGQVEKSAFGPRDPVGAFRELCAGLGQGTAVQVSALVLVWFVARGPQQRRAAAIGVLLVSTADLALANAPHVLTVPQALFEETPRAVELIAEAERRDPSPGPFRVHRMPYWDLYSWWVTPSEDRVRDFVAWERDTIQPKYGLAYGISYTLALGVAELYDYEWFFGGFLRTADAQAARFLNIPEGKKVVVYPRRAFDLWNSRYFILPAFPNGWGDDQRGYAEFLRDSESIYPDTRKFEEPGGDEYRKNWIEREDFQILRNETAYPRAWVVHDARFLDPIRGLERTDRDRPMEELLFENGPFWHDAERHVFDPTRLAWIESEQRTRLLPFLTRGAPKKSEAVNFVSYEPQRVEIDAVLEDAGLVILADIYYPGWHLTIDGQEAPIYRANRIMRGAAVPAGRHRLVYTYRPLSFRIGGAITLATLGTVVLLAIVFTLRPLSWPAKPEPPSPAEASFS